MYAILFFRRVVKADNIARLSYCCRFDWKSSRTSHFPSHDCGSLRSSSFDLHLETRIHVDWVDVPLHLGLPGLLGILTNILVLVNGRFQLGFYPKSHWRREQQDYRVRG